MGGCLVLPWFVAILSRSGDTFLVESLGKDLFAKGGERAGIARRAARAIILRCSGSPSGRQRRSPCWLRPAVWAARREPGTRFLLAWIIPAWIVFEIVITKLPHYVLPLYPAIAILTAGALDTGLLSRNRWLVRGTSGWFIVPLVLCLAAIIISIYIGRQFDLLPWPFAAAAMIVGLIAWWLYESDGAERSLPARCGRFHPDCRRALRFDLSFDDVAISERHAGRNTAGGRLCRIR